MRSDKGMAQRDTRNRREAKSEDPPFCTQLSGRRKETGEKGDGRKADGNERIRTERAG